MVHVLSRALFGFVIRTASLLPRLLVTIITTVSTVGTVTPGLTFRFVADAATAPVVVPPVVPTAIGTSYSNNGLVAGISAPSTWSLYIRRSVVEFVDSLYPTVDNPECLREQRLEGGRNGSRNGLGGPGGGVSEAAAASSTEKEVARRQFLASTSEDFPKQRDTNEERLYADKAEARSPNTNGRSYAKKTPFCDYFAPLEADIPGYGDIIGGNLRAKNLEECLAACDAADNGQTCASVEFSPAVAADERRKETKERAASGNSDTESDSASLSASESHALNAILAIHNPLLGSCILNSNRYAKVNVKYEDYKLYIRKGWPGGDAVWTDMPTSTVRSIAFFILAWIVGVGAVVHGGKWLFSGGRQKNDIGQEMERSNGGNKESSDANPIAKKSISQIERESIAIGKKNPIPSPTFHHLNTLRFLAIFHVVIYHYLDRNSIGGTAQWFLRTWDYYWNYAWNFSSPQGGPTATQTRSWSNSFHASPSYTLAESETPITWLLIHGIWNMSMHGYSPVEYFGILSGFVTHYAEKRKARNSKSREGSGRKEGSGGREGGESSAMPDPETDRQGSRRLQNKTDNDDNQTEAHPDSHPRSESQPDSHADSGSASAPTFQSTLSKVLNRTLRVMLAAWVSLWLLIWVYSSTWSASLQELGYFPPYLWHYCLALQAWPFFEDTIRYKINGPCWTISSLVWSWVFYYVGRWALGKCGNEENGLNGLRLSFGRRLGWAPKFPSDPLTSFRARILLTLFVGMIPHAILFYMTDGEAFYSFGILHDRLYTWPPIFFVHNFLLGVLLAEKLEQVHWVAGTKRSEDTRSRKSSWHPLVADFCLVLIVGFYFCVKPCGGDWRSSARFFQAFLAPGLWTLYIYCSCYNAGVRNPDTTLRVTETDTIQATESEVERRKAPEHTDATEATSGPLLGRFLSQKVFQLPCFAAVSLGVYVFQLPMNMAFSSVLFAEKISNEGHALAGMWFVVYCLLLWYVSYLYCVLLEPPMLKGIRRGIALSFTMVWDRLFQSLMALWVKRVWTTVSKLFGMAGWRLGILTWYRSYCGTGGGNRRRASVRVAV